MTHLCKTCPWLPVTHLAWIETRHPNSIHGFYTCLLQWVVKYFCLFFSISAREWFRLCLLGFLCWLPMNPLLLQRGRAFNNGLTTLQFWPQAQWVPYLLLASNHLPNPDAGNTFELMDSFFFSFFLSALGLGSNFSMFELLYPLKMGMILLSTYMRMRILCKFLKRTVQIRRLISTCWSSFNPWGDSCDLRFISSLTALWNIQLIRFKILPNLHCVRMTHQVCTQRYLGNGFLDNTSTKRASSS